MAVDTATKRAAAVNVSSPWRGILPYPPDGDADSAGDRQITPFMYSGILATVFVPPPTTGTPFDSGIWPPQGEVRRQYRRRQVEEVTPAAEVIDAKAPETRTEQLTAEEIQDIRDIYDLIRHS